MQLYNGHLIMVSLIFICKLAGYESTRIIKPMSKEAKTQFTKLLTSIANVNEQKIKALKQFVALDQVNAASGVLRHVDNHKQDPVLAILVLNNNPARNLLYKLYDIDENSKNKAFKDTAENMLQLTKQNYKDRAKDHRKYIDATYQNGKEHIRKRIEETAKEIKDGDEIIRGKESEKETIGNKKIRKEVSSASKNSDIEKEKRHGKELTKVEGISNMKDKDVLRIWKSCNKKASKVCVKACKSAYKAVCASYKCSGRMKRSFRKHCKSSCKEKFIEDDV